MQAHEQSRRNDRLPPLPPKWTMRFFAISALASLVAATPALAQPANSTIGASGGSTGPTFPNPSSIGVILPDAVKPHPPAPFGVAQMGMAAIERPERVPHPQLTRRSIGHADQ